MTSTDQYYAYRICWDVITGNIDDDLAYEPFSLANISMQNIAVL